MAEQIGPRKFEGKHTIDSNKRTTSYSKRAADGKIEVVKRKCPFCGHHKAIKNNSMIFEKIFKCTKCKRRY